MKVITSNKEEINVESLEKKKIFYMGKDREKYIINKSIIAGEFWKIIDICPECGKMYSTQFRHYNEICSKCKKRKTNLDKYGTESITQSDYFKKKSKESKIEKYNDENYHNVKSAQETCFKKYGSRAFNIEIAKKTKLEKYGDENYNNQEKIEQSKLEKYGSKTYNNQKKMKKTLFERQGVEHNFQAGSLREISDKKKEELYGSSVMFLTKYFKEKSKQTKTDKYNDENYNNQEKTKQTNLNKYGNEYVLSSKIIREKIIQSRIKKFYNKLIESNRLSNLVIPLFSLEEYVNVWNLYDWKCVKCGKVFQDNLRDGKIPRCPSCFPKFQSSISKEEKEIVDWLKSLNLIVEENNRDLISPLELDIYIPSKNLAIEFDGLYWHSELQGKDSNYHLDKTTKCKELGIQLLHVWENEWKEKQDIVKSIIKSKLGLYDRAIGARQCNIKEISNQEASNFYFENHIQSSCISKINLGLFFNDELVSCISFSRPRFNKHYQWEITRFANLLNTTVHGSFSKLWSYFVKNYKPENLITYSDKRYFDGSIYKKYFTELQDSKPSYWYIKDGQLYSRMEFQKHKLSKLEQFDSSLTEWENMQLNGWDRIWDCGNKVFKL